MLAQFILFHYIYKTAFKKLPILLTNKMTNENSLTFFAVYFFP